MKELSFLISLKDNLTGKLAQAKKSVNSFAQSSRDALTKIGIGGAGLWGIVTGVKNLLSPAEQVKSALNNLSAVNVSNPTLDKLYKDAQAFSTQFGQSATDYIEATHAIRKSLRGISDSELPRYTKAINTLSIASKSSTAEASQYMADMVNEYQFAAKTMGNIPFAEMMASKAAYMSQNFGAGLADIQKMIKDNPLSTKLNIGMDEQLSVMGSLNITQGSNAGSAYNDFLANAAKGGKQLGVSLTNAKGELLSFPDILDKLQAKFGNTLDGNLKAQKALNAAFGNGAQALMDTWGQADTLRRHMAQLGNTHGLDRSAEMAAKMANLWSRLDKVWERMRISLGARLMPAIEPLANKLIGIGEQLAKWMDMFPNITRMIGYVAVAVLAFAAAGAVVNVATGAWSFIWKGILPLLNLAKKALMGVRLAAMAMASGFAAITWPILAIIVAIGAVVIAVIKFWQPIKAFIDGFIEGFAQAWEAMKPISPAFQVIGDALDWVWNSVKSLFNWFSELLTPIEYTQDELASVTHQGKLFGQGMVEAIGLIMKPIELVGQLITWLGEQFKHLIDWIIEGCKGLYNSVAATLNKLPGIEIDLLPTLETENLNKVLSAGLQPLLNQEGENAITTLPAPPGGAMGAIVGAGIGKQLNTQNKNSTVKNDTRVNTVNIYPQNQETFTSLIESQELNAG